jgi:hypothetical protein
LPLAAEPLKTNMAWYAASTPDTDLRVLNGSEDGLSPFFVAEAGSTNQITGPDTVTVTVAGAPHS